MADKVDKLLTDYFTGVLDKEITMRKSALSISNSLDENVGGGKLQNNYSNQVETQLIREEQDPLLKTLKHQKLVCDMWTLGMKPDRLKVLKAIYTKSDDETWTSISLDAHVSISTIRDWRSELKKSVGHFAFGGQ